eukprot:3337445-Pleurochrysis_carterae.AAC.11
MACFTLLCMPSCSHTWLKRRARANACAATALRGCQLPRTRLTAAAISRTTTMAAVTSAITFVCAQHARCESHILYAA